MASKFKVGDPVIIREPDHADYGREGKVIGLLQHGLPYSVNVQIGDEYPELFAEKDLQPVIEAPSTQPEMVEHPPHYGGEDDPYEVIKVAEAWGLDKDAYLFNVLKYIARAGKKGSVLEDLRKGHFYLGRKITNLVKETAK